MRKYVLAVGSLTLLLLAVSGQRTCCPPVAAAAPEASAPYVCWFTSDAITVDGKLDEAAWVRAEEITQFYVLEPVGGVSQSPTTARLLWGNEYLYVAFECEDADIWPYSDKADDELWFGDVVELFIKPSVEALPYYEFVIAPSEAMYDGRYTSRGAGGYNRFKGWSSNATVAVAIDGTMDNAEDTDRGYTVEIAVPLSAFAGATPPADGVTWTFSVFRYDYSKVYEDPLLLMAIPESRHHGFHYYEGYRPLRFEK